MNDYVENIAWVKRVVHDCMPMGIADRSDLKHYDQSIEQLLAISRESYEHLSLLWEGLSPPWDDWFIQRCVPWWREYKRIIEANRKLAEEMLP